jgi:hypothetical protein
VIVALDARTHDSTGKSLGEFKAVRGNTFIGDRNEKGHVRGRFGRETILFTDLEDWEVVCAMRHAVRTGFGKVRKGVAQWEKDRARELVQWFKDGMPLK